MAVDLSRGEGVGARATHAPRHSLGCADQNAFQNTIGGDKQAPTPGELLADDSVTEIMVNGPHKVYVERYGKLMLTDKQFLDDASVMAVIERIVDLIEQRCALTICRLTAPAAGSAEIGE